MISDFSCVFFSQSLSLLLMLRLLLLLPLLSLSLACCCCSFFPFLSFAALLHACCAAKWCPVFTTHYGCGLSYYKLCVSFFRPIMIINIFVDNIYYRFLFLFKSSAQRTANPLYWAAMVVVAVIAVCFGYFVAIDRSTHCHALHSTHAIKHMQAYSANG